MPSVFNLSWDNTALVESGNVSGQVASYRKKSVGGAFITAGFTPPNPIAIPGNTTTSPSLDVNTIYEFKLETSCGINGPAINDNGIVEKIAFSCISVTTLSLSDTAMQLIFDVTGLDINGVVATLKKVSDSSVVTGPLTVNKIGNLITINVTGLTQNTAYNWEIALKTVINGVTVFSNDAAFLNAYCNIPLTTLVTASCPAPLSLTVNASLV